MLTTLFSACIADVVSVARSQAFFEESPEARQKRMEASSFPRAISDYLKTVSAEVFVTDIRALLPLLTSGQGIPGRLLESTREASFESYRMDIPSVPSSKRTSQKSTVNLEQIELSSEFLSDMNALLHDIVRDTDAERLPNGFVLAFCSALSEEVAECLDAEQVSVAKLGSELAQSLQKILQAKRTLELGREIQPFLKTQTNVDSPLIQSPYQLSVQQKQEVRASLRERYPGSFPLFETESSLGGGMRLFYKGELLDESWITQITQMLEKFHVDRS